MLAVSMKEREHNIVTNSFGIAIVIVVFFVHLSRFLNSCLISVHQKCLHRIQIKNRPTPLIWLYVMSCFDLSKDMRIKIGSVVGNNKLPKVKYGISLVQSKPTLLLKIFVSTTYWLQFYIYISWIVIFHPIMQLIACNRPNKSFTNL